MPEPDPGDSSRRMKQAKSDQAHNRRLTGTEWGSGNSAWMVRATARTHGRHHRDNADAITEVEVVA